MRAGRALLLAVLAHAPAAFPALAPYDFTGHWSGSTSSTIQLVAANADLTATGPRTFSGMATFGGVSCSVRGKRKRKVVMRVACVDGSKGRLVGVLDVATDSVAGVARFVKRHRRSSLAFTLTRAAAAPVCGNATAETGEECDDGNSVDGDGCSAACTIEVTAAPLDESEPNSVPVSADVVPALPALARGTVSPGVDQDFFAVTVAGSDLVLETSDASGPGSCSADTDTVLELWASDGTTVLAVDDDGGLAPCSRLELHGLTPGLYYACVRSATLTTIPAYVLRIVAP